MNPVLGICYLLGGISCYCFRTVTNLDVDAFSTLLIPTLVLLHLYISPFTKVEESFHVQATRDVLVHGIPFRNVDTAVAGQYDHVEFPGAVPRTFLGAVVLAGLSKPWITWMREGLGMQIICEFRSFKGFFYWKSSELADCD